MFTTTKLKVELAALRAQLVAEEGRRERAELELERIRQDFNTVVAMLSNKAQAHPVRSLDRDPFAEDESQLDTFLSPAPGDFIDPDEFIGSLKDEA